MNEHHSGVEDLSGPVSAEAELTRRHFEVVGEGLRADLRKIAESQTATLKSIDAMRADLMRLLQPHDA